MKVLMIAIDVVNCVIALFLAPVIMAQARLGAKRIPNTYRVLDRFNVSPISHHYYQPIFNPHTLPTSLWGSPREMAGVNMNEECQLELLRSFFYQDELDNVPTEKTDSLDFYHNQSFGPADSEILYSVARHFKPAKVVEIGSGYSTRMMKRALDRNLEEGLQSSHICVEPYEMPWLELLGLDEVIREKVEDVSMDIFTSLNSNDVLFIDSSHVIRAGGDVLFEFLEILPRLKKGVLVHFHDIFLPYEYPQRWFVSNRRFWTEQYLLQAFLAFNSEFEIISAVNWLANNHQEDLARVCPVYSSQKRGHGSFWIRKVA